MRYQGRITSWNDDRGFGFITPSGGGRRVFVHISAFPRGHGRPTENELVTYELAADGTKGPRAEAVLYVEPGRTSARSRPFRHSERRGRRTSVTRSIVYLVIVASLAWYGWQRAAQHPGLFERFLEGEPAAGSVSTARFECRGKTRCNQMTSCEEAKFYLRNCPGVKIDGDRDGVPCEDQWCGHGFW